MYATSRAVGNPMAEKIRHGYRTLAKAADPAVGMSLPAPAVVPNLPNKKDVKNAGCSGLLIENKGAEKVIRMSS